MPSVLQHGQYWWMARSTRQGSLEDLDVVAGIGSSRMFTLFHFRERDWHSACQMEVLAPSTLCFTS